MSFRVTRMFLPVIFLTAFRMGWGEVGDSLKEPVRPAERITNQAEKNLPLVLESWMHRIELNQGVHAWGRENDGMRVFQEWIALLTKNRDSSEETKRRIGKSLERYVVRGNIQPLGFVGTSLPVPGYDQGDFDMTLMGCSTLLGLFRDDRLLLTDATLIHLIKNVAKVWGQTPKAYFDVLFVS